MCPHCRQLGYQETPQGNRCVGCGLISDAADWKRAGETRAAMRRDAKARERGPKPVIERTA